MGINDEEISKYERDGYIVIESGVAESVLDEIVADLSDKYDSTEPLDVTYQSTGRIQDAWRINQNIKNLALNPKILSLLEKFYKRKPLAFQTLNFPVGTEQQPHSDTIHFNSSPAGYMCGVWIALEDMDEDNGTLVFYPQSHKLPEVTLHDVGCEREERSLLNPLQVARRALRKAGIVKSLPTLFTDDAYPLYEKHIAQVIKDNNLKPKYAVIKKGQALIWAANLLHGGSPHKDKSRTRHSQVTHYFFENCQYYTPMLSTAADKHWREPNWIS